MRIESDKIVLQEFSASNPVFKSYCGFLRDLENIKMIGRQEYLLTINEEDIRDYLISVNNSPNDSFFGVWEKEHGNFIGTLKIGHIDWRISTGDLGIMIGDREFRGKGLSENICQMGLEYAFHTLGLRRMSAGCYEKNIAMCKCFERIGFKKIGVERENVTLNGEFCNHVLYDMLRKEWEGLQNDTE